jgi:hypothetical protein
MANAEHLALLQQGTAIWNDSETKQSRMVTGSKWGEPQQGTSSG